jgi:preprotein translocase subunit SecE
MEQKNHNMIGKIFYVVIIIMVPIIKFILWIIDYLSL